MDKGRSWNRRCKRGTRGRRLERNVCLRGFSGIRCRGRDGAGLGKVRKRNGVSGSWERPREGVRGRDGLGKVGVTLLVPRGGW